MSIRRKFYRWGVIRVVKSPLPVIVVGNITVGGTGKTPFTIALVNFLKSRGYSPGVVTRGYGGSVADSMQVHLIATEDSVELVGDEPYLIAAKTGVPVAVCRHRPRAVGLLSRSTDCDVVISDDGLQHYAMDRDIEIVCIDGNRGLGNGMMLPAGPLREPASRMQTADFVISKQKSTVCADYFVLSGDQFESLSGNGDFRSIDTYNGRTVHAVAGIANPHAFFQTLKEQGLKLTEHVFPDHHAYSKNDFDFAGDYPIVMTEKDAVKCRSFALADAWYLAVEPQFPTDILERIVNKLDRVNKSKVAS